MNTRSVSQSNCCLVNGFAADITRNFSRLPTIAEAMICFSYTRNSKEKNAANKNVVKEVCLIFLNLK